MARRNSRSVTESIVKYSGYPVLLGTIDYTNASKTNNQASVAFGTSGLAGKILLLQASTDVYVLPVLTATATVSSSTGVLIVANERVQITMPDMDVMDEPGDTPIWLAAIRSSVSGNLRVWELL
jgi:hypothetical protein